MNNTQGGVNPGGYSGSGYGFAQNRLAMNVPLPPTAQRPPTTGDAQPVLNPGGPEQVAPAGAALVPWWHQLGHPGFHMPTKTPQPLGILGIHFGNPERPVTSGLWRAY